jgi:hypothetical protein
MAGAHIFAMYTDGTGNVTVSARNGNQGEVEPVFNSTLMSGVELLEGTGISNGMMTANIRCGFLLPCISHLNHRCSVLSMDLH